MTADAVKGAGGGDRKKGAAKMYAMMNKFEGDLHNGTPTSHGNYNSNQDNAAGKVLQELNDLREKVARSESDYLNHVRVPLLIACRRRRRLVYR